MCVRNLICTFFVLSSSSSLAQMERDVLDEIIVVSNRIPIPLENIATSVSVIYEKEIQSYGNISLKDVIRQTSAIGASSNGGIGSTSSIRIRGEEGFRTLGSRR